MLAALCGCGTPPRVTPPSLPPSALERIYAQAGLPFDSAVLLKPNEMDQNDDDAFKFAPLIIQEIAAKATPRDPANSPGRLIESHWKVLLEKTEPVIYVRRGQVQVHGRSREQITYFWCYSLHVGSARAAVLPMQGVRITLNAAGQPALWEVLADSSGAKVMYVSRSLAEAASSEFGPPLPGRRSSIERSVADAPDSVVAGIIEDGPIPMGPIVHVRAESHQIAAVICRCMSTQAKRIADQAYYDIVSAAKPPANNLIEKTRERYGRGTQFWPMDDPASNDLEKRLRLPEEF